MKKTKIAVLTFIGILLNLIIACQSAETYKEKESDHPITEDSTAKKEITQGDIPENWEKIDWGKGYYIAFPQQPKKRTVKSRKRIEYTLTETDYVLYASQTDLSEEPLFKQNRKLKSVFYDAVLKDLIEDLSDDDAEPELILKEEFLFLNIYEAIRAELKAEDFQMELKSVVIGKKLYTYAFILWENPELEEQETIMELKKQFFYSFGKELYIQ